MVESKMMKHRCRPFFLVFAIAAATILAFSDTCDGLASSSSSSSSPMMSSKSGDNFGSRPLPSNQLGSSSSSSSSNSNRLPTTATEAVAIGISTDSYHKGPGLRSRIYQGIKQRIDDRKKKRSVEEVADIAHFQSLISNNKQESKLIAVMFHAPFCKACQASLPLFNRMARKYASKVKFISVPVTKFNEDKLKMMGISKFPFGRIYDPTRRGQLVDELPMLRKLVPKFDDRLKFLITKGDKGKDSNGE